MTGSMSRALEVTDQDERLLVAADGALAFEVAEPNPKLVVLTLRGVGLAESVPRRLSGAVGANLQRVVAGKRPASTQTFVEASGHRKLVALVRMFAVSDRFRG